MGLSADEQLKKLSQRPDYEIDYSDIPPITDFTGWVIFSEINKEFAEVIEHSAPEKLIVSVTKARSMKHYYC